MVALMKITRDICRLLGLSSGPPVQQPQEELMDCGAAHHDPCDDGPMSQDALNCEEDLSEDEKARQRAERRKAKKKRRRKRKKQEQVNQSESAEQGDEDGGAESDLDESESEAKVIAVTETHVQKEETKHAKSAASYKLATSPSSAHQRTTTAEEEPEWDVNSAFVANAASHIKPKGSCRKSKENKENEARKETNGTDITTKKTTSLAEKGIKLVQEGQYLQAANMFTEAIKCDPDDYRFFGNRSYCYYCLEQYTQALADAERAIQLAPDWPKGYFRKGSALKGMKLYSDAQKAMEQVLKLDNNCDEAVNDLFYCKLLQLMELGLNEMDSALLLERYSTVQEVLASFSDATRAASQDQSVALPGCPSPSLWVGNVTTELTENHLRDLFKMYGEIDSIRVLHERFCAFVNFKDANMAARAMERLNGYIIENTRLVVRYPDRRPQRVLPTPLRTCLSVTQQISAARPHQRRRVLLLENHRLPFWRPVSLQTRFRSERQGQEAVAALENSLVVYRKPGRNRRKDLASTEWTSFCRLEITWTRLRDKVSVKPSNAGGVTIGTGLSLRNEVTFAAVTHGDLPLPETSQSSEMFCTSCCSDHMVY
ncbi:uncharacterized protein [Nerophis lumbriciformis]|uniref:uncharacterized protein isoform X3 n=1 Tax=Nerophis lumbriciformis TaxID=546530 RepID=UPI002ADF4611|nr:uncharacterized protein zgc:123010 isoform X3 [Nerophis lumbriciformis]